MEKITINYRADDYLEANRINYRTNPTTKWIKLIYSLLCIAFVIFFLLTYLFRQEIDIFSLGFIIFSSIFIGYEWTFLPGASQKMFQEQKKFFQEVTFIFREGEIEQICAISEIKLKWIYKYIKTEKMLLVFSNPGSIIIIPKKYCGGEDQYENICNLVSRMPQGNDSDAP